MKRLIIISLFFCLLFAGSCTPNNFSDGSRSTTPKKLVVSSDKNYVPHKVLDALDGDYGQYLTLFKSTDYIVGISSHIDGARSSTEKLECYSGESRFKISTRSTSRELPALISSIDGVELNQKNIESYIPTKGFEDRSLDVFGKTVTYKMKTSRVVQTRSDDEELEEELEEDFEMYIPERISILAPAATNMEDNNPLCYYGDFVIRWNADEQNTNGVIVVVEWSGGMVLGNDIDNTSVIRVAAVPDTGEARLNPSLFEGIPDTAICHLAVVRGAVEDVQGEEYSYKLIGETHHLISFILIREVEVI